MTVLRRLLRFLLGAAALGIGVLLVVLYFPVMHKPFVHQAPEPPPDYRQTVAGLEALVAETPGSVRPDAAPIVLDHGRPTEHVFVLLHGLSNNPAQFAPLGRLLFERGHNVIIPRLPYHGEKDRMTEDWGRLTARDMLESGNRAADLARGMGKKVTVAGLSINGTVTAWMAQNRSDLHRVVLLAPFLAPAGLPSWAVSPVERLLLRLPNMFFWWNPKLRDKNPGPPYAYPRFPTRVIGQTMLLGSDVLSASRTTPPKSRSILVVTTASDLAADNALTDRLVAQWAAFQPVESVRFPREDAVPHDFIDIHQPDQKTDQVYAKLITLFER